MTHTISRRGFMTVAAGAAAATRATGAAPAILAAGAAERPALLGGPPVRGTPFPSWPVVGAREEKELLDVLHSGKWFRLDGKTVERFEEAYARLTGARHCIATANGTSALFASLAGLGVGPGDEVILPPYTFIATLNVVFLHYALPTFVDSDPETLQMDARKLEAAVTERTAVIMPVHLGGNACDLDAILEIAGRRKVPVLEDACQAHLGEWRGLKLGTLGAAGCFSFQASKNLNSGEGGAILTSDDALYDRCWAFHDNCRARRGRPAPPLGGRGANLRLTEFQAGLLLAQMARVEEQAKTREENARYLTQRLREVPGILPAKAYDGCTRNAYHLYMLRYEPQAFAGLPRARFLEALRAEGVPCSPGYSAMNREKYVAATLASRAYQRIYPKEVLADWAERNLCPANDRLCEEAVWLTQTMLLGPRKDMDDVAAAVRTIHAAAAELAKA
ncbi:MAG TPA: DegT/DnrJ/EryC1/StrS family aminotransferase [Vicinamibacteria bacterium]|nr:DegT/DnrJ/EryC1/StrS family aminotransferase [Vicinamibacteria bacterium]